MENLEVIRKIIQYLAYWRTYTEYSSSALLNDVNITNEGLACLLLNATYDWCLKNLNDVSTNFPAIDLGDKTHGIGISVTASNTSTYIQDRIATNIKHEIFECYPNHYFFITTKKKDYTADFDTKGKYVFVKSEHIVDIQDLINKIKTLGVDKQNDILRILEKYVPKLKSNFIEEITPQDIAKVLGEFSNQNQNLSRTISEKIGNIQRTQFPEKNRLNSLSEGYIKLIQEHSLPFFQQFEDFLGKFENAYFKKVYLNIVSDLQQVILLTRNDFDRFDDIFLAIEDTCRTKVPSLANERRILKILLHFMYFQCDIGENKK